MAPFGSMMYPLIEFVAPADTEIVAAAFTKSKITCEAMTPVPKASEPVPESVMLTAEILTIK
jgi:hypothetical protein